MASKYKYSMKLRGYSIACQPMKGLIGVKEDSTGRYHNILTYDRQLEPREMRLYDLVFIGKEQ